MFRAKLLTLRWTVPAAVACALIVTVAVLSRMSFDATAAGNSIFSPDTVGSVGWDADLELDASGYPVVSYRDATNSTAKVLHCGNPNCTAGNSITTPNGTGFGGGDGFDTSLALDSNGRPVVAYGADDGFGTKFLTIMHCNDVNCAGGNESIEVPQEGEQPSLVLDANGYPVVSFYRALLQTLVVMHCNDVNCAGGDETFTFVDPTFDDVGPYSSIQLDSNGYPVVSYYDVTNGALKLLHCDDADCSSGNVETVDDGSGNNVGFTTSLALDSMDRPVISYWDGSVADLKVAHCNDIDCNGGDESITTPDAAGSMGYGSSIKLDSGNPVISYSDGTNAALRVMRCDDANCAGGNENIQTLDAGSGAIWTSLELDGSARPVVSYRDSSSSDLTVLHCFDTKCLGKTSTPTPTDTPVPTNTPVGPGPTPTSPAVGGVAELPGLEPALELHERASPSQRWHAYAALGGVVAAAGLAVAGALLTRGRRAR